MNASELDDRAAPIITQCYELLISKVTDLDKPVWIAEGSTGRCGFCLAGVGRTNWNGEWIHQFTGMNRRITVKEEDIIYLMKRIGLSWVHVLCSCGNVHASDCGSAHRCGGVVLPRPISAEIEWSGNYHHLPRPSLQRPLARLIEISTRKGEPV